MPAYQLNLARPLKHLLYLAYRLGVRWRAGKAILSQVPTDALREALVRDFIQGEYGAAYSITQRDRERLVKQFERIIAVVPSGTALVVHLTLAREILSVPPDIAGAVIECGSWKGASAASLSLVCQLVGRRLLVCDSFGGLPDEGVELYAVPHNGSYGYLRGGMFRGTLDEVRANIRDYGALDVCDFVPGLFADTLPALHQPLVCAFLDVDLVSSNETCLRAIWPLLAEHCAVYTDDAGNMAVARLFFHDNWWQANVGCAAPGLIGAGSGLPLMPNWSPLGYARKTSSFDPKQWRRVSYLYYPDEQPET